MASQLDAERNLMNEPSSGLRRKKARRLLKSPSSHDVYTLDQFRNDLPFDEQHDLGSYENVADTHREASREKRTQNPADNVTVLRSEYSSYLNLPQSAEVYGGDDGGGVNSLKVSESAFRRLMWPAFAICAPMLLLSAALLFIIFKYLVKPVENIFDPDTEFEVLKDRSYLLVNFSATKLVFLASFLSTTGPLLAGCIMSLVAILVYRDLLKASQVTYFPTLPTPYQMSLLIGVLSASYESLLHSIKYLWLRKRRTRTSPVLLYAIVVFMLSILLGVAVTLTDAYLHIATQTVSVTSYMKATTPTAQLGRGISPYCLGVDRVEHNYGYPCTFAHTVETVSNKDFQNGQAEMQRIAHNSSTISQIQLADIDSIEGVRTAYLLPSAHEPPDRTNYQAETVGVATGCELIPPEICNLTQWGGSNAYTSFNCSPQFWGVLGMQPVFSPVFGSRPVSQYLSFLAVNPSANLIYNYFADEDLETVYNTVDLNASALQPAEAKPWPNEELKTTIYAAFAWRLGVSNFANYGQNGMYRSNLVHRYNGTTYIDSFMKCAVSAYDIRYTWANGTLHSIHAAKFQNGTVLNMWTGLIPYTSNINGGGSQLQDRAQQSAIAGNTTAAYVQKFGELMSQDALSAIGAYTSSRTVLQQQDQRTILVAKVPKLALGLLLACSLLYPLIGAVLVGCAGRASNTTGSTAPLFSYWGLTKAAFVENSAQDEAASVDSSMRRPHYDEDNFRLYVRQQGKEGHQFGLFKRTHTGEIMEIARSQTNVASWI